MGYISTGMGDRFSGLLVSLMALRLTLVDRKPFWPCFFVCHTCLIMEVKQQLAMLVLGWVTVSTGFSDGFAAHASRPKPLFWLCFS